MGLAEALSLPSGLVMVCGPTGQGKSTAIAEALAKTSARGVVMMGEVRHRDDAVGSVDLALEGMLVVAVARVPTAAAGFGKLVELGADPARVAQAAIRSFGFRLLRGATDRFSVSEELVVTPAVRALIARHASATAIHQLAVDEGMRPLRQVVMELVRRGAATLEQALLMTPA